ncbi:MAG TPA: OmpA family protein [Polyangia bacterium]|nr:OmpA family protein [Polyangia bacterium]
MPTSRIRSAAVLAAALLLGAGPSGDPITAQLKNDVPGGQKPTLTITAVERVANLRLELTRDDGQKFTLTHPALTPRQSVTLPIGDGQPGRAHYQGQLTMDLSDKRSWSFDLKFDTFIRGALEVSYDYGHVDVENHTMQFRLSRPAASAELVVMGDDGQELATAKATYKGEPPGTWLSITWQPKGPGTVAQLRLRASSTDGFTSRVELTPWSLIPEHEDVNFASDSAEIAPSESGKLDASLVKIREAVRRAAPFTKVQLYLAGHTDTVGGKEKNRKLSLARARAIGVYFRKHGLDIPILYEGFGEELLKVGTADETDEPKNRRTDYILEPIGAPPPESLSRKGVRAHWQTLP